MTNGELRRWKIATAMAADPVWRAVATRMMTVAGIADFKFRLAEQIDPAVVSAIVHCGRMSRKDTK